MALQKEQIESAFVTLIKGYNFFLNIRSEGAISIITLKNEHLKISLTEEYQPQNIFNVTFFDGTNFWLGLSTLYEFKSLPFEFELGCIKPTDFQKVADFLIEYYSDLLLGDETVKQNLLKFYHKKS